MPPRPSNSISRYCPNGVPSTSASRQQWFSNTISAPSRPDHKIGFKPRRAGIRTVQVDEIRRMNVRSKVRITLF
jgi:hypothetical protein